MFFRRPDGITVRLPPPAGIAEAWRMHVNCYSYAQIAHRLTELGYKHVTRSESARKWVGYGQKIAARRAEELGDPITRRVEEIARYSSWLVELDAGVHAGGLKLDKAMPWRMRAAQELSRAAAGIVAQSEQGGMLAGRYLVAVDQLEDIDDQDVLVTYMDDHGNDPEYQQQS